MRTLHAARKEKILKRFHVHLGVPDLRASIRFYSNMFGMPPTVEKSDYAKWMIDDPRVNFAISERGGSAGLNHLGLQADSADELAGIREQFAAADAANTVDEAGAHCCYAHGNKHWTQDPQGIAWEGFQTLDTIPVFGASDMTPSDAASPTPASCGTGSKSAGGCCVPTTESPPIAKGSSCCA
jgi:catechol 2,3-dioxygenase-like lactoylglutathione lyase family enzyme